MKTKTYVWFPFHRDWNECAKAFIAHIRSMSGSENTVNLYSRILIQFFASCSKSPADYTRADVERFLTSPTAAKWRHGTPPSASTRHARLTALASFYKFASNWVIIVDGKRRRLLDEPPPTVGIASGKRANHHNTFTPDDLHRFFAAIPTDTVIGARDKALCLAYFWTARRRSEIARLKWGDLEQRTIPDGKGGIRTITVYHFRGKGKGIEDDCAELPAPALAALDHYLTLSGRKGTIQPSDPLFPVIGPQSWQGKRKPLSPLSNRALADIIKKYVALAGITTHVTIHSFRHSRARAAYEASNHDVLAVKKLLRHSSLATTQIYLEELSGTIDTTADALMAQYGNL